jgi:hypothetical protein|nr:MAG TPA: DNA-directed RNA polymerase [Caudoviricetes sp.]
MTSEKREKAIKYLTEEIRFLRMAPQINGCGPENWAEQLEVMETCLQAVRSVHFADAGKMQPLTLEQLREMDGQPVRVVHPKTKDWGIYSYIALVFVDYNRGIVLLTNKMGGRTVALRDEDSFYRESAVVFPYIIPDEAHIDRNAWWECFTKPNTCESCEVYVKSSEERKSICSDCHERSRYIQADFCPRCGKPLTEKAWDEMEKKVRVVMA